MIGTLAPIIGLLTVAFLSPGPNNLIIIGAAARGGFRRTIPILMGVVFGTVVLYLLAFAGLAQLLATHSAIRVSLLVAGVAYLIFLGLLALVQTPRPAGDQLNAREPSFLGMAFFQMMNPKSIILIVTIAAVNTNGVAGLAVIIVLIAATAAISLSIWALAGTALAGLLSNPRKRRVFDGVLGLLLIASAIMLLFYGWDALR